MIEDLKLSPVVDPILNLMVRDSGRMPGFKRVALGIFEIGHFGFDIILRANHINYSDNFHAGFYGVCDNHQQILDKVEILGDEHRKFVVSLTRITKSKEPESRGWRWHKWGDYIGDHEPTCEYLHDEPEIEEVFCYHVYEIK